MEHKKLILENRTYLPMEIFLYLAGKVVNEGRISKNGKQYCLASIFTLKDGDYAIYSDLNKKSDRLTLVKINGDGEII